MNPTPNLIVQTGDVGLQVISLRKSYRKRPVIRNVSINMGRGEVVALLGPNGSGKTTCFYAIAGLVAPEGGKVIIDGRDVTTLPMYRRAQLGIGYLPQEMSIFRGMSVEDNIMSILEIAVKDRHQRRERLETLLAEFSIEHLRRASAMALSGGNGGGSKLHAALRQGRNMCCWTNLSPGSIRLPWPRSGILLPI
ncbi:lipopolysaccharide export system ATP-binding protein LptB [Yoonia vestfoldensis]|uniref:Lipopolysaccharide export system ATP-binding protein LptB n=1 Tax=Yoonia vestfoldensis TaxID=245188 RepID=A0A1Y0EH44_9RHOB|nr:lipopolysaccharide export system ATP-binding protein LptB [Yoonia vestfoldensis]